MAERYRAMLPPEASDGQRAEAASLLGGALFSAGRVEASIAPLSEALDLTVSEVGRRDGRTVRGPSRWVVPEVTSGSIEEADRLRAAIARHRAYGADRVRSTPWRTSTPSSQRGQLPRGLLAVLDSALAVGTALNAAPAIHPALPEWHALRAEASNGSGSPNPSVR